MSFKRRVLLTLAVGAIAALPSFAATIDLGINGDALVGPDFIYFSSNYPINTAFAPAPSSPTTVTPANYGLVQVAQVRVRLYAALMGWKSIPAARFTSMVNVLIPISQTSNWLPSAANWAWSSRILISFHI